MPAQIGSLFVSLTADFGGFQRNMTSAEGVVASTSAGMRRNIGLTERSVSALQRTTNSGIRPYALISAARAFDTVQQRANLLRGTLFATTAAFGGLAAALTSNVVSRYLDTFTGLENQIRVVSASSADLAANFAAIADVADRSRSSLAAVATLYTRLQKSSPDTSADKLLRRVETITKALQLGGATAQEAASAAIQFSQAIASNRLGGDELRAVLETPLGQNLAKGLGVTIGQLRKMSIQGKLTADVLFKALDKISGEIDGQFAKSISTIDQALTVADNKIILYAGSLNKTYGITKLITGAIGEFGDNLGTIVPLLATIGTLLGANFAARLVTGFAGARITKLAEGIIAITKARKDDIKTAREQLAAAQKANAAALTSVQGATTAATGNVRGLAPKADLKAYERDLAAVQKADADHLGLLEQKVAINQRLSEVSKGTSVGEIKASQAIAAQQIKVNDALAEQVRLKREAAIAAGAASNLRSGLSAPAKFADEAAAQKALVELQKQQVAVAKQVTREESALAKTREGYTKAYNASFVAAANERASVLVEEKRLVDQLAQSDEHRTKLGQQLQKSGGVIQTAGLAEANRSLQEATVSAGNAEIAVQRAGGALRAAEAAGSRFAVGLTAAQVAGKSLVAFLGGPWGVALTAAIVLMTVLGERSRASAEKIAAAEAAVKDELDRLSGTLDQQSANIQKTILEDKLKAETEKLTSITSVLADTRDQITAQISSLLEQKIFGGASPDQINAIKALIAGFKEGSVGVDELRSKMLALGLSSHAIDPIIAAMQAAQKEADRAGIAIQEIQKRISNLDGQIARVTIDVQVHDTSKMLDLARDAQGLADRAQYGVAQRAMREQIDLAQKRKQILDAAGETDALKNSPSKIAAREQELLEGGYARTREEARGLATEELNLTEKTRLAAKGAGSAAKDYENFAHKLAELQQTAAGAYLSDLDQKVVDFARSLKDGSTLMKDYIAAVNSGDLSKAPQQLLEARSALQQIGAADTWRSIIQQYGNGAQLAGQFADKQAELNLLVAQGKITAEQAGAAYGDFVSQFGQYQWIDDLTNAFSTFANSAITDFDNIGDAALTLLKQIGQIILQMTVLQPLQDALKAGLAGGATGIGGGGGFGDILGGLFGGGGSATSEEIDFFKLIPGLYHNTGTVGRPSASRKVSAAAFANAPRFHNGTLNPGEVASVLQKGEQVMRGVDAQSALGMVNNMSSRLAGGGTVVEISLSKDLEGRIVATAANHSVRISQDTVKQYDRHVLPTSVQRVNGDKRARGK